MTTSIYFNNYEAQNEQTLIENLTIEAIRIYGHNVHYCPRVLLNKDEIYGESDVAIYNGSHMVEMYIEDYDGAGFSMDTNFLQKFGLEVRPTTVFAVAVTTFNNEVNSLSTLDLDRPREGDIIYYPLTDRPFIITYVDKFPVFYQAGKLQTWRITCELFEYAGEKFNTGIAALDTTLTSYSTDILNFTLYDHNGNYIINEANNYVVNEDYGAATELLDWLDESEEIQTESDTFVDFTIIDPFSEGNI